MTLPEPGDLNWGSPLNDAILAAQADAASAKADASSARSTAIEAHSTAQSVKEFVEAPTDEQIAAKVAEVASASQGAVDARVDAKVDPIRDLSDETFAANLSASIDNRAIPRWQPSTAYAAGAKVVNPTGQIVQARAAFTSGATYSATNWMLAPTDQATIPIARQAGDGRTSALWEFIHNGTGGVGGYIYHWLVGASSEAGDWIAGIGIDAGLGNGFIFRNKAKGIGLKVEQLNSVSSATAYGFTVEQKSATAPAAFLTQNTTGTADLMRFESYINPTEDTSYLTHWYGYGVEAGGVLSKSGKLLWKQNVEIVGSNLDVRDNDSVVATDRYRVKVRPRDITMHSLSASGSWYGARMVVSGSYTFLGVAPPSADPDSATYNNLILMRHFGGNPMLAFFNTAPVVQPAAITQTYSTASRTVANPTATAVATTAATQTTPYGFATQAQADALVTAVNALIADMAADKQNLNAVIDTLQSLGLVAP